MTALSTSYGQTQPEEGIWVPSWRAKLIVLDKLELEQLKVYEIPSLAKQVRLLESNLEDQKKVTANKDLEIANLTNELYLANQQQANSLEIAEEWKAMYKKERRQKFIVGGVGIGIIILLVLVSN